MYTTSVRNAYLKLLLLCTREYKISHHTNILVFIRSLSFLCVAHILYVSLSACLYYLPLNIYMAFTNTLTQQNNTTSHTFNGSVV